MGALPPLEPGVAEPRRPRSSIGRIEARSVAVDPRPGPKPGPDIALAGAAKTASFIDTPVRADVPFVSNGYSLDTPRIDDACGVSHPAGAF
jgi:hypothetical protein